MILLLAAGELRAAGGLAAHERIQNRGTARAGSGIGSPGKFSYDWFWLFYEREKTGTAMTFVIRPFYLKTGTEESFFQASLMPFLFWRYKKPGYDKWKWLFGLGQSDDVIHADGKRDYDFGFFPFLFLGFGSEAAAENYFFLWPIGGMLKKKFVTDKISAWIFPGFLLFVFFPPASILSYTTLAYVAASLLPAYLYYEQDDFRAWNIMFPLFYYGRGRLREDIRLFPFYSHFHKTGWYDKYSFLLIFNYQRFYYHDDLHQVFFLFPLFGRKWSRSGRVGAVTLLWPFFSWGYDKRTGDWELNIPWPLVQMKDTENPKIYKRIFFPIYGIYRYLNNETMFITPLYFRLKKSSYRFDSEQHISFLVFWFYRRSYHHRSDPYYGNEWRYFKTWPLFSVEYNDLGDAQFNMVSLLPFRDRAGYEKMYQPFWTVLEYTRFRDGEKRLGLFFRIYFQRWRRDFFFCKIPFVISVGRREKRLTELSFLESMFGYTENWKGRYLRIFWVPIRLGDSDGTLPKEDLGEDGSGGGQSVSDGSRLLIEKPPNAVSLTHHFRWGKGYSESSLTDLLGLSR